MELRPHIEKFNRRFAEVEAALSDPKVFDIPARAQELGREYARLKELVATGATWDTDGFTPALPGRLRLPGCEQAHSTVSALLALATDDDMHRPLLLMLVPSVPDAGLVQKLACVTPSTVLPPAQLTVVAAPVVDSALQVFALVPQFCRP